jgi:hypothetical protein
MAIPEFTAEASLITPRVTHRARVGTTLLGDDVRAADCQSSFVGCMIFSSVFMPFLIPACYADFRACAGYPHPSDPTIRR